VDEVPDDLAARLHAERLSVEAHSHFKVAGFFRRLPQGKDDLGLGFEVGNALQQGAEDFGGTVNPSAHLVELGQVPHGRHRVVLGLFKLLQKQALHVLGGQFDHFALGWARHPEVELPVL
jgi:hypothetical protein